ncbi:hypothetical protein AAMO2058_000525600 [Amorphochlora amoebiformis]
MYLCRTRQLLALLSPLVSSSTLRESISFTQSTAEALGSISTAEAVGILEGYKNDKQRIVSESCKVALDIADDWTDSPNAGTD